MNEPLQSTPVPAPTPVPPVQPSAPAQPLAPQPMTQTTMQMNVRGEPRRSWAFPITIIVALLLLVAGAAAYKFVPAVQEVIGFYLGATPAPAEEVATTTPTLETYSNSQYGFTFDYPNGWFVNTNMPTNPASPQLAVIGVESHDPALPHTYPEPTNYNVRVEVYPIDTFLFDIDPSARVEYATSTGQWLRKDCTDFINSCKNITTTATSSNITVGGMPGYQLVGYNPGYILVPLKNGYGLVLSLLKTDGASIDATLQQVLNSFRVQ